MNQNMTSPAHGQPPGPSVDPAAEWLSPAETAAWLRCSSKLIYRLCETDPTFPAIKVGGLIRIRRSRLETWLAHKHRAAARSLNPGAGRQTPNENRGETTR